MTQFPAQPTNPYDAYGQHIEPRRTSGLAVTALVLSLVSIIPCCGPVTAPLAVILGLIGAIILGPRAVRKGRGMALTAMIIGLILTVVYIVGLIWGWNTVMKPVIDGPVEAMTAGYAGDMAAFKAEFHGAGATASDDEARQFIETLRSRYGEFRSLKFDDKDRRQPQFGNPEVEFAYVITFANATMKAQAQRIFSDPRRGGFVNKWGFIKVIDPDHGNVRYPAPSGATTTPPPTTPPTAPPTDTGASDDAASDDGG